MRGALLNHCVPEQPGTRSAQEMDRVLALPSTQFRGLGAWREDRARSSKREMGASVRV